MTFSEFLAPVEYVAGMIWDWMSVTPFFVGPTIADWFKFVIAVYFGWKVVGALFHGGVHIDLSSKKANKRTGGNGRQTFTSHPPQYQYKRSNES